VADKYEERGTHKSNIPAKTTLHNHAWKKNEKPFNSAETSVTRRDDVLIPINVTPTFNSYKSESSKPGISIKIQTYINQENSTITIKKDKIVEEKHIMNIENSGRFRAKVSDVSTLLSKIEKSRNSDNMIELSKALLK